jgi:hypothetical protein
MGQNGGKRPGAGRPKGSQARHTIQAITFKKALIDAVLKEKKPLIDALVAKAKTGDIPALREIVDRVLGRATESIDLTSGGDKLNIQISEVVARKHDILPGDTDPGSGTDSG